jgi:hypothetical protein
MGFASSLQEKGESAKEELLTQVYQQWTVVDICIGWSQ